MKYTEQARGLLCLEYSIGRRLPEDFLIECTLSRCVSGNRSSWSVRYLKLCLAFFSFFFPFSFYPQLRGLELLRKMLV